MNTEIITLISLLIAVSALLLTLWQNILTRRALQAQVYLALRELQIEARYTEGVAVIASLKKYKDYDSFAASVPKNKQKIIYETVSFLNYTAHLVEEKFIPRQTVWNMYFWAYKTSNQKLLSWWLDEQRRYHPRRFAAFERMCLHVGRINDEAIKKFDKKYHMNR